jgi:biopolymer transport protein ExbD
MLFTRKRQSEVELNLSSFSDIAFLLLTFFILATSFISNEGTKMQIPAGEASQNQNSDKQPTILLTKEEMRYQEKAMTLKDLRTALLAEKFKDKAPEARVIILECHDEVPYQTYFNVVTAIEAAGGVMAVMVPEKSGEEGQ